MAGWINLDKWKYNSRIKTIKQEIPSTLEEMIPDMKKIQAYTRYLRKYNPKELKKLQKTSEYRAFVDLTKKLGSEL